MNIRARAILGSAVLALAAVSTAQDVPANERLTISDKGDVYELTVPVSGVVMTVSKGQLIPSKSSGSSGPRYFLLEDRKTAFIVSGWFEPEQAFKGMREFWAGERTSLDRQGLRVEDESFEQVASWNTVLYDVRVGGVRNSNVRAEWTHSGTWVDLHLSLTNREPQAANRQTLREFLKEIHVIERPR